MEPGPISFSCTASRRSKKGCHVRRAQQPVQRHTVHAPFLTLLSAPASIPSKNRRCLCDRSNSLQTRWKKILHSRKRILPTRPKSAAHVMNINTEGLVEKITRVPSSDTGSELRRGSGEDRMTRGMGVWLTGGGGSPGRPRGVIWGSGLCKGEDL